MDQREEMVLMWFSGRYSAREVAERFETSRTTLYDWTARFQSNGRAGLQDRPPIARSCPHKTLAEIEQRILEARKRYGWGPKKLRHKLMAADPDVRWPQPSTIGDILARHGQIEARPRQRKTLTPFRRKYEPSAAGELTTVDFKGHFRMGNGVYCYPLTMMDLTSRFLLACDALPSTAFEGAWPVYRRVFREYGLPLAVQSDNGVPFAHPTSLARISRLSVQLMKLGIQPVLNDPGHPEQNGAHERMHATLAAATTRPPASNQRQQQKKFDEFRSLYNDERPHETLGNAVPRSKFNGSPRPFPEKEPTPGYGTHFEVRLVSHNGFIKFNGRRLLLTGALAGERVGLEPIDDGIWSIQFAQFEIGRLDQRSGDIQ